MKQIKKEDLKEVIRLSKKWWDDFKCDNDVLYDELSQARLKAFGSPYTPLNDIVMCIHRLEDKKTILKTYYKVLEALGYELV